MGTDDRQLKSGESGAADLADQQLFVRLFVAHQRRVHGFIRTLIPNSSDADDVLQDTSIVGLSKFSSSFLRGRQAADFCVDEFVAWICTIARFEALKCCRQKKRGRLLFSEALTEQLAEIHARQIEYLEVRHDALKGCLEKLPVSDRSVLLCHYESNLTGPEISARLGRPLNTVYKALQRIRNNLLECVHRTIRAEGHL